MGPDVGTGEGAWAKGLFELACVPRQSLRAQGRGFYSVKGRTRVLSQSFVEPTVGTARIGTARLAFGERNIAAAVVAVELPRLAGVHTPPVAWPRIVLAVRTDRML